MTHSATRLARLAAVTALSALLLVPGLASAAPVTARLPDGLAAGAHAVAVTPPGDPGTAQPSIQYLQAMEHAADPLTFTPGERVTVGFRPRSGDRWPVGGAAPVALPAGNASGVQMRAAGTGTTWSVRPPAGWQGSALAGVGPSSGTLDGTVRLSSTATLSTATATDPATAADTIAPALRHEVFGFLPYWELSDASTVIDDSTLSTIAIFGVGVDDAGNLVKTNGDGTPTTGWAAWTSAKATTVITNAHQDGVRVVLTVQGFAWTTGQATTQANLLGSDAARLNLAQQIAAAVADRGADGVNLDFEPIVSGYSAQFTDLVRQIRTQLDLVAPGYQVTWDALGSVGNQPVADATAAGAADAVVIMGYDYRTASSGQAASIDPLQGPVYDLTDTVTAFTSRTSPSKVMLALPWYGRAWSTSTDALNAVNISGTQYGDSTTPVYDVAATYAEQYGRRWDPIEQSPWTAYQKQTCTATYGCVTSWRELYFEDADSLALRYDLAIRAGLRGIGIWALGYDGARPELRAGLAAKFLADTTPPVVGVSTLAPTQADEGFTVAWTAWDESPVVGYDVQVSVDGGAWADWRTGIATTSAVFLGQTGHTYGFRVRATDQPGNVSAWDDAIPTSLATAPPAFGTDGYATILVDGLRMRSGATTTANIVRTLSAGDVVRIIGGPSVSGGYTWYRVQGPLLQWRPVDAAELGLWIAVSGNGFTNAAPRVPIWSTTVAAPMHGLTVGTGGLREVTPNGDGLTDTIHVAWTNDVALDALTLRVYRADGTLVDTRALGATAAGPAGFDWDGRSGGTPLPPATYVLQLVGARGAASYALPADTPVTDELVADYGIEVKPVSVIRIAGADRYATSAAISAAIFDAGVPVAYLATGLNWPDALSGAAAAGYAGGPLLLTDPLQLPATTAAELARLKPGRIVVLGGTGVLSEAVRTAAAAYTTGGATRLAGPDRYATSAAISAATFSPGVPVAYLATGLNWPDALSGAAAAGFSGGPLLLTDPSALRASTAAELARLKPGRIVILGGTGAVSAAVATAAAAYTSGGVTRLAGPDRYATSAAISTATFVSGVPAAFLATGRNWPDALSGAAAAGALGGPLLLTDPFTLPASTATELHRLGPARLYVLGGVSVVSNAVMVAAGAAVAS